MNPVVRLFVGCWSSVVDTAPLQYRLSDIRTLLFPTPGDLYPLQRGEICFVAFMTGGRGVHEFAVRERCGVGPTGYVSWESPSATIDLGNDPLTVRVLPIRVKDVPFPEPGQYEFILLCDGAELMPSFYLEARA